MRHGKKSQMSHVRLFAVLMVLIVMCAPLARAADWGKAAEDYLAELTHRPAAAGPAEVREGRPFWQGPLPWFGLAIGGIGALAFRRLWWRDPLLRWCRENAPALALFGGTTLLAVLIAVLN